MPEGGGGVRDFGRIYIYELLQIFWPKSWSESGVEFHSKRDLVWADVLQRET